MKKRTLLTAAGMMSVALLAGCGNTANGTGKIESFAVESFVAESSVAKSSAAESSVAESSVAGSVAATGTITQDQALEAALNYYKINTPGYEAGAETGDYWDVSTNEAGEIVVLYHSYTGAINRYYVDAASGETYVTELVPGIIDDERKTGETFNIRDYLGVTGQQSNTVNTIDNASAPIQYETADGFMASFLLASDRERIDTTNDYGVLYRVVYQASLEGDELIACGSMDYRNFKDQDPITITSDQTHVFKVDDNTVYRMIGDESGTNTVTKEEFAGLLDKLKDSGMYFEVEISNGVAASATIGV